MSTAIQHIAGQTYHGRKGSVRNAFRYSVDYVLLDAEARQDTPRLFGRNRSRIVGLHDRDHGGPTGQGRGAAWVREVLEQYQIAGITRIELLAQPKVLGHVFNPVSFWLCRKAEALIAVIAEVTNTFGERHSYLVHHADQRAIEPDDRMHAKKIFYVSPFQVVEGDYTFRFDINERRIGVWIDYNQPKGGLIATLTGTCQELTNRSILQMLWRRPFGARRVLALIHWQALKLWIKGAKYRTRPNPPEKEVSR